MNYTPFQLGSGTKSLPDELYAYWGCHGYRYATVVEVPPQIKAAMVRPYSQPKHETQNYFPMGDRNFQVESKTSNADVKTHEWIWVQPLSEQKSTYRSVLIG